MSEHTDADKAQFDADPRQFETTRLEQGERFSVGLNDDDDTVAYCDQQAETATVYSDGPDGRQKAVVPLDLFRAVAVEGDF